MYIVHISICLAVLFTADCQPMLVFFSCSQSAPDMPFGFVDVQHYSGLGGEGWVDVFQTIGDILMYCCRKVERLLQDVFSESA